MPSQLRLPRTSPLAMLERPVLNKLQQSNANLNGKRMWQRITNTPCERRIFWFHIPYTCRQSIAWGIEGHFSSNLIEQLQAHNLHLEVTATCKSMHSEAEERRPDYSPERKWKGSGGTNRPLVIFQYGNQRGIISSFVKALLSLNMKNWRKVWTQHTQLRLISEQLFTPLAHYVKRAKFSSSNKLKKSILSCWRGLFYLEHWPHVLCKKSYLLWNCRYELPWMTD